MAIETLSVDQARRIALAAQGFARPKSSETSNWRRIGQAVGTMGLLQIDSVNVLIRSHYLPVFSRIGPYDRASLDRRAWARRDRALFEYWAHEASLLPLALHPLFRWRMDRAARRQQIYGGLATFARERKGYVAGVLDEVRDRGPVSARDLSERGERTGPWWGWHDGKIALEYLFWAGEVTTATRRGFERVYDLPERVIPAEIQALPTPSEAEAQRELVRLAMRCMGIATAADLRDYFRLPVAGTKRAIAELVEEGALVPAAVEGWRQEAFLDPDAAWPARGTGTALLSPFDPLVWERARTERLFRFRYRIEIYVPADKRKFGYYVLPFLYRGRLVARVDLKADRQDGVLRALAAHGEGRRCTGAAVEALAAELRRLADWLGLSGVVVGQRGDLCGRLVDLRTEDCAAD